MYDQIFANSELDFVTALRAEHGDAYAVATMKNHWSGYINEEMIDRAQALGVDTVRVRAAASRRVARVQRRRVALASARAAASPSRVCL